MEQKARTIRLKEDSFKKEPLIQQTLLYIYFEDRWRNFFKWTPKWLDVEKIMWKALEVEEKNNPNGLWSKEWEKVSERIPYLKEFKLPVRVTCGDMGEVDEEEWRYRVEVCILPKESTYVGGSRRGSKKFSINNYTFKMGSLVNALKSVPVKYGLAFGTECFGINQNVEPTDYFPGGGVYFYVWLPYKISRADYRILAREMAGAIRSYIRSVILDLRNIEEGFEET